jgi:hypothetical protein
MSVATPREPTPFDQLPTSFGAFKPVGSLMIGLPTRENAEQALAALAATGRAPAGIRHFSSPQILPGLQAMATQEGPLANIGFETVLVHRFIERAQQGYHWLLVEVGGTADAAAVADIARASQATMAIHYRTLTIEELI